MQDCQNGDEHEHKYNINTKKEGTAFVLRPSRVILLQQQTLKMFYIMFTAYHASVVGVKMLCGSNTDKIITCVVLVYSQVDSAVLK